jgi:CBS domain-containing protein
MSKVRDAMIADPPALEASASAQQAGELFDRPEVRAVLVCEDGRLTGIVTRKTLVREIVARGRDPRGTVLGELAEDPMFTLDPDAELDDAFRALEERDLDRAPVVEPDGRLAGVLSRAVVQRRLAEDEPPVEAET